MAKKRKLRSSEPETSKAPEQPPEPPQPQAPPVEEEDVRTIPIEIEDQQTLEMAVDEAKEEEEAGGEDGAEEEEEVEEEEEEEEEEDEEEEEPGQGNDQSGETLAQNGGVSGGSANGGGEAEAEDEDDEPVEKLLEPFSREQLLALVKQAVEKHPSFAANVRSLADADPAHRKIFVHGLGWDTTAETLISEFGKYGEIEDCKAVTDRVSGKSKGYAFILFKRRSGARRALREPQKRIGNRTTSSQLASAGPVPAPPPVSAPSVSEYTLRKIFVSNVSSEVDPGRLLEFFRQFGEVEEGPLGLDRQTGKPKGFALFVYKTVESARRALEEPHKTFEGVTLNCQKAIDGPKQNKAFHQHHHQQQQQQQQQHHHHHQQHHHHQPQQHQQQQYHQRKDKSKYSAGPGHLMAPSAPAPAPAPVGYNPGVQGGPPLNPALGQALTALLATQGAGLGIGNLLGGIGGVPTSQPGPPPPAGYGNQAAAGYGAQPGMQGSYQNQQMGQGGPRPHHPGPGAPYMGH